MHNLVNFLIFLNSQIVITFMDKFIFYKPRFLYKFINFNVTNIQLIKVSAVDTFAARATFSVLFHAFASLGYASSLASTSIENEVMYIFRYTSQTTCSLLFCYLLGPSIVCKICTIHGIYLAIHCQIKTN